MFNCINLQIPVFLNMTLHRVVNVYSASLNKYKNEPYGGKQPMTYARGEKKPWIKNTPMGEPCSPEKGL